MPLAEGCNHGSVVGAAFTRISQELCSLPRSSRRVLVGCFLLMASICVCHLAQTGRERRVLTSAAMLTAVDFKGAPSYELHDGHKFLAADIDSHGNLLRFVSGGFFVNNSARMVLLHPLPSVPSASPGTFCCYAFPRNMVFVPNSTVFYFIALERCRNSSSFAYDRNFDAYSIRKSDLQPVKNGSKSHVEGELISYWWPTDSSNGSRVLSYEISGNASLLDMAVIYGMDLARAATHLVLSSNPSQPGRPSNLVFLSVADGSRSSMSFPNHILGALAFNPSKTRLYGVGHSPEPMVWSSPVTESGRPLQGLIKAVTFLRYTSGPGEDRNLISPRSVTLNGTCIYFLNGSHLLGLEPESASWKMKVLVGKAEGQLMGSDGPALNASFYGGRDVVATADGCNVFIAEDVVIRWVKMDSPCTKAHSVETVAGYGREDTRIGNVGADTLFGLSSLALQEYGERLYLYVGIYSGAVYELEIDTRQLHSCHTPQVSHSQAPPSASIPTGSGTSLHSQDIFLAVTFLLLPSLVLF